MAAYKNVTKMKGIMNKKLIIKNQNAKNNNKFLQFHHFNSKFTGKQIWKNY